MRPLSAFMLTEITDCCVDVSREICRQSRGASVQFGLQQIADEAFKIQRAGPKLSEFRSGKVLLWHKDAESILKACRRLLTNQLDEARSVRGRSMLKFDPHGEVCLRLRLDGVQPEVRHLEFDDNLLLTGSLESHRLDDLLDWRAKDKWFGADTPQGRRRALHVLRSLEVLVLRADSPDAKLKMARMALSLAMHHLPGTRWHDHAFDLATGVCQAADVFRLTASRRVDDLVLKSWFIRSQLEWVRIAPHMNASTNYLNCVIQGERMPPTVVLEVRQALDEVLRINAIRLRLSTGDYKLVSDHASATSMNARMLTAAGGADAEREVKRSYHYSRRLNLQSFNPYGIAFPLIRDIAAKEIQHAALKCEKLILECEANGCRDVASAYAALRLQLSIVDHRVWTANSFVHTLADEAVRSDEISFLCSHIYTRKLVKPLLRR